MTAGMASASAVSRAQRFRHKAATRILRIAVVERTFGTFGLIGASATNRHHRAGDVRRLFVLVRRALLQRCRMARLKPRPYLRD
jgi:hypothetical protein